MMRSISKIQRDETGLRLVEREYAELKKEALGLLSARPMVYLSDPHEAIEKAMWCYERGMVPLIGEASAEIANLMADRYAIDSLITDALCLRKLEPHLEKRSELLESMSILGMTFNKGKLAPYFKYAKKVRFVRIDSDGVYVGEEEAAAH